MNTLRVFFVLLLALSCFHLGADSCSAADFPKPFNTQNPKDVPLSAQEALKCLKLPEGFSATLFASEPQVQQPIAMTFDERGRLWVAENYTYAESKVNYDLTLRDRIVILEDSDGDGVADKRTVFWDKGQRVTSLALGFGGVYVLAAPQLLFIPDKNYDDVPDGEPTVLLDGWNSGRVRHNIVNGLRWGPDGWLYGRHGIMDSSHVGTPGAPPEQRTRLNCCIWRYHPTQQTFEVVCTGTTNPWGFDYDEHGQLFFSNTVIGHFWHVLPGAHYKRMYGQDLNPYVYALIDQCADHYHWDTGKNWTDSRNVVGLTDKLGGGHAHIGLMIYQGDNWPDEYRNAAFMCNMHGRRINVDRIVRKGAGYSAEHAPDMFPSTDVWFRGMDLLAGPDGGVYLADWSDVGECHENDGVHRTTGRIYKIVYRTPKKVEPFNLRKLSSSELVKLHEHKNDYYVREARRLLQERAHAGENLADVQQVLQEKLASQADVKARLRALWTLHVTKGDDKLQTLDLLLDKEEHIRVWAEKLYAGLKRSEADEVKYFKARAEEKSGLVLSFMASSAQKIAEPARRLQVVKALTQHTAFREDKNLSLLIWYAAEPLVLAYPQEMTQIALAPSTPTLVKRYIARRLAEEWAKKPEPVHTLVAASLQSSEETLLEITQGISEATRGWKSIPTPTLWEGWQASLKKAKSPQGLEFAQTLGVLFGDGRTLAELRQTALDAKSEPQARQAALAALVQSNDKELPNLLPKLLADRAVTTQVLRGLAQNEFAETPALILKQFPNLRSEDRTEAINTLVSRPSYAAALLQAIAEGKVPRNEVTPFQARQIQGFNKKELAEQLSKVWGEIRATPAAKQEQLTKLQAEFTPSKLARADLAKGRALFNKSCAACHKLYGEGQAVGPDLTGANRQSLEYLLENLIDPSALVPAEFTLTIFELKGGRTINGVIVEKQERTVTIQTPTDRLTIEKTSIESQRTTPLSLMPDGLLDPLTADDRQHLLAYLMSKQQVDLPRK